MQKSSDFKSRENKELEEVPLSLLEQLPFIRVLDLSRRKIKLLLATLWKCRNIEYLDVSYTQIYYLSEFIGYLSQLQFLNMSRYSNIETFPNVIGSLSKLHFYICLDVPNLHQYNTICNI